MSRTRANNRVMADGYTAISYLAMTRRALSPGAPDLREHVHRDARAQPDAYEPPGEAARVGAAQHADCGRHARGRERHVRDRARRGARAVQWNGTRHWLSAPARTAGRAGRPHGPGR